MDKDIIFYSNYCAYCKEVLTKISKTPLNSKLTYICVDDQNIKLPPFVKAVPTIFLIKEQKILVDENIESWIRTKTATQQRSGEVMAYLGSGDFSASFSNLDDSPDKSFVSEFTYLDDPIEQINTPQEMSDNSGSANNSNNSFEKLQQQRQMEFTGQQRM